MNMSNPRVINKRGRGKRGRQMVRLLCSSGISPLFVSGGFLWFVIFLCFAISVSQSLFWADLSACLLPPVGSYWDWFLLPLHLHGGGFSFSFFLWSPSSCPQRTVRAYLLWLPLGILIKSHRKVGRQPFTFLRFTCAYSGYFLAQSILSILWLRTRWILVFFKRLSNIQLQIYLSVMTNSSVSTSVSSLVSR